MIVVTGATGKLGSRVVQNLLKHLPASSVGASVRDPSKASELASKGVVVHQGDFDHPTSLEKAFQGADKVLIVSGVALGKEGVNQHRSAIEAAKKASVKKIYYTSHQAANLSSHFQAAIDHAATEKLLEESGVEFVSFRDGAHMDIISNFIAGTPYTGIVTVPKHGKFSWTSHDDLAEAIAKLMTTDESLPKYITLTGTESLDMADIAKLLSDRDGKEIKFVEAEWEPYKAQLLEHGVPEKYANMYKGMFDAAEAGEFDQIDPYLEKLLGRKPITVKEMLSQQPQAK